MTISFRLSIEQYRDFCLGFFLELPPAHEIEDSISKMGNDEFEAWRNRLYAQYIQYREPVKELVQLIRGDYHPVRDRDNSHKIDPLKSSENSALKQQYENVFSGTFDEFFANVPSFKRMGDDLQAAKSAKEMSRRLNIVVDGTPFCALKLIDAPDIDDSPVWVVEHDGKRCLVANQCGVMRFVERDYLDSRIQLYKEAIRASEDVLSLLD